MKALPLISTPFHMMAFLFHQILGATLAAGLNYLAFAGGIAAEEAKLKVSRLNPASACVCLKAYGRAGGVCALDRN